MDPVNPLDELIARFRTRWETDPQYRARVSGLIGLATVVGLCSCMLIASLVANSFFGSVGLGGGSGGVQQPNVGLVNFVPTFPTTTLPTWAVQATPAGQVAPNSKTPAPTSTRPVAKTPCSSACGGGVTYTAAWSPTSWGTCANGATCTFSVHASASGVSISVQITFCNGASITPPAGQTNSRGNWSYSFAGLGAGSRASADVTVQVQRGVPQVFNPPCV